MKLADSLVFTLEELRTCKAMTQREVAQKLGISQGHYADMEKGRRKPNIDNMHTLAILYGTSMDFIYHSFYRRKVVFNLPDHGLEYGMRKSQGADADYVKDYLEERGEWTRAHYDFVQSPDSVPMPEWARPPHRMI